MQAQQKHPILLAAPVQANISQQRILERLHYVSGFSEQVVFLHGPQGAGKSTLIELFLEQASDYAEVAFISANGKQADAHLRTQILTQLYGTIQVSNARLGEQMTRLRQISHAIIVIDDADRLSQGFINELQQAIVQVLAQAPGSRVSVVLSGLTSWAKQFQEMHSGAELPLLMAVEPFSFSEQYDFVCAMLPKALQASWTQQRHRRELATLTGYPGEIQRHLERNLRPQAMDLGDGVAPYDRGATDDDDGVAVALGQHTKRRRAAVRGAPISLFKMALLVMLGSGIALAAVYHQSIAEQYDVLAARFAEEPVVEATTEPDVTTDEVATDNVATAEISANVPAVETPETAEKEAQTDVAADSIPPDLAISFDDALFDLNSAAQLETTEGTVNLAFARNRDAQATETVAESVPESAPEPVQEATPASNSVTQAYDNEWALAQPAGNYTLQLNMLSSPEWLDTFLTNNNLNDSARVYQYGEDANQRLVTLYGSFDSAAAARAAIAGLPANVQNLQPFPKSFAAIQQNINANVE